MGTGYFMLVLAFVTASGAGITTIPVPFNSRAECEVQGKAAVEQLTGFGRDAHFTCVQAKR